MSKETLEDLQINTLIGFTSKRGNAWHYKAEMQGAEPNHYENAIPIEDVRRRLFDWQAVEGEINATALTDSGVISGTNNDEFKPVMRSDNGFILGIFKQGYQPHQYDKWLLTYVEHILDADLQIGSAGVLKQGRQAWVQIEMEETLTAGAKGAEPVEFRPFVTAASSLDGSLSSTYLNGVQVVRCDNSLSAALTQQDFRIKVKHSRNSLGRVLEVREALGLVHTTADAFTEQVNKLTAEYVSDATWDAFVKALTTPPKKVAGKISQRSQTMLANKVEALNKQWNYDVRTAPWKNTAYGVLSAVNTYVHHDQNVKGDRAQRNAQLTITGGFDKLDQHTLDVLAAVR